MVIRHDLLLRRAFGLARHSQSGKKSRGNLVSNGGVVIAAQRLNATGYAVKRTGYRIKPYGQLVSVS